MKDIITLNNLKIGKSARVIEVKNVGSIYRRLLDLGFIPGTIVSAYLKSPFQDPIAYRIKNATIAIRKIDSQNILVEELS